MLFDGRLISVDPQVGYTKEKAIRNHVYKVKVQLNLNERCILAVFGQLYQIATNHKVTSFKTSDPAVLSYQPFQVNNSLNNILRNIEAGC